MIYRGSANGKPSDFGSDYEGSNPSPRAMIELIMLLILSCVIGFTCAALLDWICEDIDL